jgi:hypothetical protein
MKHIFIHTGTIPQYLQDNIEVSKYFGNDTLLVS